MDTNISTPFMEFFTNNHKIQVWLEVQNNEYLLNIWGVK